MKKPALFILALLLIAFISVYFIIPQYITATSSVKIDHSDFNVARFIIRKNAWGLWWPGKHQPGDSSDYRLQGTTFTLTNATNTSIDMQINGKDQLQSKVDYLAIDDGSTTVSWNARILSSLNPFTRIGQFIRIKDQQRQMDDVLKQFKAFMQKDKNVYGMDIKLEKVKDPVLLMTFTTVDTYPTTETVYKLIDKLRNEVKAQGAQVTNYPMLNIHKTDDHEYGVMTALATSKELKPANGAVVNRMVKGANILVAEVTGGRKTIDNAFGQMKTYLREHRLVEPAMPFESIVTDRRAQPDTTKWVTRIYFPVF